MLYNTIYFHNIITLEELKKQYKKLVFKHHPDRPTGDNKTMQQINTEYEQLFAKVKDIHAKADGTTYTKANAETASQFKNLLNILLHLDGLEIEIIGCFVWCGGNTKQHKDILKAQGFKWHSTKKLWYKAPADYHKTSHKKYTIDEIRNMYGSQGKFEGKDNSLKIEA